MRKGSEAGWSLSSLADLCTLVTKMEATAFVNVPAEIIFEELLF